MGAHKFKGLELSRDLHPGQMNAGGSADDYATVIGGKAVAITRGQGRALSTT